jgi:hypothetical protein
MPDYVVLRHIPEGQWADCYEVTYVDQTAKSAEEAIEEVAKDGVKGGEGRYIAIPNEYWVAQNVVVKRIAEVNMEQVDLV